MPCLSYTQNVLGSLQTIQQDKTLSVDDKIVQSLTLIGKIREESATIAEVAEKAFCILYPEESQNFFSHNMSGRTIESLTPIWAPGQA